MVLQTFDHLDYTKEIINMVHIENGAMVKTPTLREVLYVLCFGA